jgi:hypothetical protein
MCSRAEIVAKNLVFGLLIVIIVVHRLSLTFSGIVRRVIKFCLLSLDLNQLRWILFENEAPKKY